MPLSFQPAGEPFNQAQSLQVSHADNIWHIRLNRSSKRNALSDTMVTELHHCFASLPATTSAIILDGDGEHFCAGLDLSELQERNFAEGVRHSRMWHAAFDQIRNATAPVIAVLNGAVVGGGFELASAAHLRIAEAGTFFALPEGQRGLFTGGSGSVHISRLIGVPRMTDMMLTGRSFSAEDAERFGAVNYLVAQGQGFERAAELAQRIGANAPLSNYAVMQALPHIVEMSPSQGLFTEALMASAAQSDDDAKARMAAFLAGKAAKVKPAAD
ncbi:MAG: crotonase/enoyl-CoA hydratase family protein [Burkholderiaceae bacterium]